MENGIVQRKHIWFLSLSVSHNPCCNGRWSRTKGDVAFKANQLTS